MVEDTSSRLLLSKVGEMAALRVARLKGQALLNEAVADLCGALARRRGDERSEPGSPALTTQKGR